MENIDIYSNSSIIMYRKVPNKMMNILYFIIVFLVLMLLISIFYKYPKFDYYRGIIKKDNNEYEVDVILREENLPFNRGSKIWVNRCKTKIKDIVVEKIDDEYYLVKLLVNIDDMIKIDNNIVDVHIFIRNTTILKEVLNKIKKGMM